MCFIDSFTNKAQYVFLVRATPWTRCTHRVHSGSMDTCLAGVVGSVCVIPLQVRDST